MKRYEIEQLINQVMHDFANENNLESDFYGDCYPEEIRSLENRMERMSQEEIDESVEELKEDLKDWYL